MRSTPGIPRKYSGHRVWGKRFPLVLFAGGFLALSVVVFTPTVHAQLGGAWRGGPMRVSVQVESWGADCGPRPTGSSSRGGGSFRVSEEGDQLVFHGARTRRTNGCWSDNPLVRRVSTSRQEGVWRTVCRTPPTDPRQETGTYTLRVTSEDQLSFQDVSRYNWRLNESECIATVTSRQGFARSSRPSDVEPDRAVCSPGAPARLVVRPQTIEIAPGDRAVFRAAVYDRAGCLVPGEPVRWELRRPAGLSGELRNGVFTAADTAAEAEGNFVVVATSGSFSREARALVRTQDLSSLIARRSERGALSPEGESLLEFDAGLSTAEVPAEESEEPAWEWIVGLGAGLGLAFLSFIALVIVLLRRKRQRPSMVSSSVVVVPQPGSSASEPATAHSTAPQPTPSIRDEQPSVAPPEIVGPPRVCTLCQAEYTNPRIQFCSRDGSPLVPLESAGTVENAEPTPPVAPISGLPSTSALICPFCRRGYPTDAAECREHGATLVPYAEFRDQDKKTSRVCSVCGTVYDQNRRFCGKDGSELKDQ